MNIALLGFDRQGRSALEYWSKDPANTLTICDKNPDISTPEGIAARLGEDYLKNLDSFDLLVRTPGLHPQEIVRTNNETILEKVTTVTNEFFRVCPTKNIVGVTGTKGKGTTCTLIAKMLEAGGKNVHLGGNIGIPPLELLKDNIQPEDWVVLELANFQLIDLKFSPSLAVCLMVEPEHQDWHTDVHEYMEAKKQLFRWQKPEDIAIYNAGNQSSTDIAFATKGTTIGYMHKTGAWVDFLDIKYQEQKICLVSDIKLPGKHNLQNVCAAITAVWQIAQNPEAIRSVLLTLGSLPYRIELRREVRGVKFYNDSYASAPGACEAAIEAVPENKVLILGGFDRGLSLEKLADTVKKHEQDIKKIILVGASAGRLSEVLEAKGFSNYVHESSRNMSALVARTLEFASAGDAVILSPGFASFDMFKNFEDRGQQFNRAVEAL